MGNTKKVWTTGRLGSRYGVGIRKRLIKVEQAQAKAIPCPSCGFSNVKRRAAGLFHCRKCEAEFTGGAYESRTLIGKAISKMVSQKAFSTVMQTVKESKATTLEEIEREVEKAMLDTNKT